jgi:hypothetical protein
MNAAIVGLAPGLHLEDEEDDDSDRQALAFVALHVGGELEAPQTVSKQNSVTKPTHNFFFSGPEQHCLFVESLRGKLFLLPKLWKKMYAKVKEFFEWPRSKRRRRNVAVRNVVDASRVASSNRLTVFTRVRNSFNVVRFYDRIERVKQAAEKSGFAIHGSRQIAGGLSTTYVVGSDHWIGGASVDAAFPSVQYESSESSDPLFFLQVNL